MASKQGENNMRNGWVWLSLMVILGGLADCGGQASNEAVECDFGGQTAVSLQILDESGQPQRLVRLEYQLDDGPWQALPESVSGEAVLRDGPGTYHIRLEKPGYGMEERTVVVAESESCQLAAETVEVAMARAVCPDTEPAILQIEVESESDAVEVTAVAGTTRQEIQCTDADDANCHRYALQLNREGSYTIDVAGLAGLGPMMVEDGLITYESRTSQVTLRQNNVAESVNLPGAESVSLQLSVAADEIGCPLADLRTMTALPEPDPASDEPFPKLTMFQQNNLLMTDLSVPECDAAPQPYLMTYEVSLPNGTPLRTVSASVFTGQEWQDAECGVEDGRFVCTAVVPNPLVGQPYAFKIVAAGKEYVGMRLPLDNLCLVFD
ncbi:MAG: hypothetical protein H6657_14320 [Ardenticatenaceae bacterium]|nr:hypothetical protein [Ardenticatenaceae bacterium]